MKQKVLISGLSLLLAFSLAGCGGQQAKQEPQEPKQEVQQSGAISTEPPAEPLEVKQEVVPTATVVPSEADLAEEVADQEEDLTEAVQLFEDCNETVYATGTVNIRASYTADSEKLGSLNKGDSATRTGIAIAGTEAEGWSRIQLSDGSIVYVSNKYISTTKPAPQQQQQQTSKPSGGSSQTTTPPSTGGQSQGDTSTGDVDQKALEEMMKKKNQLEKEAGYEGTDASERVDMNDPQEWSDFTQSIVDQLNP